jgi:hypothetical protein
VSGRTNKPAISRRSNKNSYDHRSAEDSGPVFFGAFDGMHGFFSSATARGTTRLGPAFFSGFTWSTGALFASSGRLERGPRSKQMMARARMSVRMSVRASQRARVLILARVWARARVSA